MTEPEQLEEFLDETFYELWQKERFGNVLEESENLLDFEDQRTTPKGETAEEQLLKLEALFNG